MQFLQAIAKWIVPLILQELAAIVKEWLAEKMDERKTIKELKAKIKELKGAKTQDEIRRAIRGLNI